MTVCLYVTSGHRSEGDWPSSPHLLTALRDEMEVKTAYAVCDRPGDAELPKSLEGEILYLTDIGGQDVDLIVVEHWLYSPDGVARVYEPWLQEQVRRGAQLLLLAFHSPDDFTEGRELIPAGLMVAEDGSSCIYGYDDLAQIDGNPRFLWCEPKTMWNVAPHLRDAYQACRGVGVLNPRAIWPHVDVLATADQSRTRKLTSSDRFQDDDNLVIWAASQNYGMGHIVLTSGDVSGRYTVENCPGNIQWLLQLIGVLRAHTTHLVGPQQVHTRSSRLPDSPAFSELSAFLDEGTATRVEERFAEAGRCFTGGAYLACVVMLGSALEAALDYMVKAHLRKAVTSDLAPRIKAGGVKDSRYWTLAEKLAVAEDVKWLHPANAKFSTVLREYRNYVHPEAALNQAAVDERAAMLCWEVATTALLDLRPE